jgi:hypothetical protein
MFSLIKADFYRCRRFCKNLKQSFVTLNANLASFEYRVLRRLLLTEVHSVKYHMLQ